MKGKSHAHVKKVTLSFLAAIASIQMTGIGTKPAQAASPAEDYLAETAQALCQAYFEVPDRIYDSFELRPDAAVVLVDTDAKIAAQVDDQCLVSGPRALDYGQLPYFFKAAFQSVASYGGKDVYALDLSYRKFFDRPGDGLFKKNSVYRTLFHEAFHLLFQHSHWTGRLEELAMAQTSPYPADWKPYYLRYRLVKALNEHYTNKTGLGPAAYWHERYKAEYASDYPLMRRIDRKEGTTRYAETLATVIKEKGAGVSEAGIRDAVLKDNFFASDAEFIRITTLSVSSYLAGGLASLILREEQGRNWEKRVAQEEISPIELLLDGVAPVPQADDPVQAGVAQDAFDRLNQRYVADVDQFLKKAADPATVFLKLPNRVAEKSYMLSNELYLTPAAAPGVEIAVNSSLLNLTLSESAGQPTEFVRYGSLDVGMNFRDDPCRGASQDPGELGYVILFPSSAVKPDGSIEFDDGNLKVRIGAGIYSEQRDGKQRRWLCL